MLQTVGSKQRLFRLPVALGTMLALAGCADDTLISPEQGALAPDAPSLATLVTGTGPTVAPDLLEVGNFRRGEDVNGSGTADTYVDFTFDQQAAVASCCSRFQLVPIDGGAPLKALDVVSGGGTTTLTVAFEGEVDANAIARGTIDKNTVQVEGEGSETSNPPQAAAISNGGNTVTPDLVSVTRDGDQLLFEFDESVAEDDDVIQNSSGLRFYTAKAETYSSSNVKQRSERVLSAIYDLPQGVTLDDAVGGFVVAGTVVDGSSNFNELDETAPLQDTGATVCSQYAPLDTRFLEAGPTEAPDLVRVGNFRRGPFTDDYEPTTCVDFSFDQVAYLNGGTRSNFHLVPLDASDALDGSTNQIPESDKPGDNIVTVIFPGDLDPSDFARGYVDTGVLNSDANNASAANPYNINQAEEISNNGNTENPDLVRVSRDGNSFLFVFDEALTDDDKVQNTSGLRLFFPEAKQNSTIPDAGSSRVEVVDDRTLRAFYQDLPGDYSLADAVGAFVVQGTVQAAIGSRGGNDGKNAFDEVFIFGNAFPSLTPLCNGYLATITGSGKVKGTSGNDVIVGSPGDDTIDGRGGNDIICGRGGDDNLKGDDGMDALFGEAGNDLLKGQDGIDFLYGGDGEDELRGQTGNDQLFGDDGADDLRGQQGADFFDGGADTDTDESDYVASEDRGQVNVP